MTAGGKGEAAENSGVKVLEVFRMHRKNEILTEKRRLFHHCSFKGEEEHAER